MFDDLFTGLLDALCPCDGPKWLERIVMTIAGVVALLVLVLLVRDTVS